MSLLRSSSRLADRETRSCRPCVLLVDDESAVRMVMGRYFALHGWEVREADDGAAAQRLLDPQAGHWFDLVICDLRMPRFSGCDLFWWLAVHRPDAVARLVFSSGDLESPDSAKFLSEARRPVLPKPFDLGELTRIVDEISGSAHAA